MFRSSAFATKKDYEEYAEEYVRDNLLNAMNAVNNLIMAYPSSKTRNDLTDINIKLLTMELDSFVNTFLKG